MNYGALIFLAAFVTLAVSWFGFVLKPQVQLGWLPQTNAPGATAAYPVARPGLAQQGLQVYRATGCAYCHSQQVTQRGTVFEAVLSDAGTNQMAVAAELRRWKPAAEPGQVMCALPAMVVRDNDRRPVETAVKALTAAGGKAALWVVPVGPDIARGWGKRRSVAEDFLFDDPVLPGSQRIGPDLANVGNRLPDPRWHLRHLYAPAAEAKGSTMTSYRYLFVQQRIGRSSSPNALLLSGRWAPRAGYEIVPTPEAEALVEYLLSLRGDVALYSTPMTVTGGGGGSTNAPPETGGGTAGTAQPAQSTTNATQAGSAATNSPATNSATK